MIETIRIHTCNVCGKRGQWDRGWNYYGSMFDEDEGTGTTCCSKKCKSLAMEFPEEYIARYRHHRDPTKAPTKLNKPTKRIN